MTTKHPQAEPGSMCLVVLGYGIPKDILQDQHYEIYLRTIFNTAFEMCTKSGVWNPVILLSGGKTDMLKPYRRTEAQEMARAFKLLMQRPAVKTHTKHWKIVLEQKSLSTLDNFLYLRDVLEQKQIKLGKVVVFCEQTRVDRVKILAKRIFKTATVHPIDFDQSANRYLDPNKIKRIMKEGLKLDLWALKSEANLAKHRALFKEKIAFLREAGPDVHTEAVRAWWDKQLEKVEQGL
jgi:hypothetical protein